jgi:hypothetical protein
LGAAAQSLECGVLVAFAQPLATMESASGLLSWLTGAAPGREFTAEELYASKGEGKMYVALNGRIYDVDPRPDMCVVHGCLSSPPADPRRSPLRPLAAVDATGTGPVRRTTSCWAATQPGLSRPWSSSRWI